MQHTNDTQHAACSQYCKPVEIVTIDVMEVLEER
jgi:hypothetical protein